MLATHKDNELNNTIEYGRPRRRFERLTVTRSNVNDLSKLIKVIEIAIGGTNRSRVPEQKFIGTSQREI